MARILRYEPHESPAYPSAFRLSLPHLLLTLSHVLVIAVVVRAAGASEAYLAWATFAALVASGLSIIVQSRTVGRFGAGYLLLAGTSGVFIAVAVAALEAGGAALLATLVVASSLFHFAISARLSLLQRVMTRAVRGTIRMLIVFSIMPIILDLLRDAPEGAAPVALPAVIAATLVTTIAFVFGARVGSRGWLLAPLLGVAAGTLVAMPFGMYDFGRVAAAPWIGVRGAGWPGLDLSFGIDFWALLPAFFIVAIINATRTVGYTAAVQDVSWRASRNPDRRAIQGAVAADGLSSILCGLLGVVPSNAHGHSSATVEVTGVASRRVGVCAGLLLCACAFSPKLIALLLAIPSAVIAAGALILFAGFFLQGMELVLKDQLDGRKALAVGLSFWVGVGFQIEAVYLDPFGPFVQRLLESGVTTGGLAMIGLTLFTDRFGRRRESMETTLDVDAIPRIQEFLAGYASRRGWGGEMRDRLHQVAEETLLNLMPGEGLGGLEGLEESDEPAGAAGAGTDESEAGIRPPRRLRLAAQLAGDGVELEFLAASDEGNIEDRMALLTAPAATPREQEFSLRLLRHLATSVRHQQYHDTDIVTIRIDAPAAVV